jgi:hypothetical protein
MSRSPLTPLSLVVLLGLVGSASGLLLQYKREEVGPAKGAPGPQNAGPESTFRFSPLRCYWRESGWDGWGASSAEVLAAFRGGGHEANAALTTFSALPGEKKVVRLFPGPGAVRTMDGKASYPCGWEVRWTRFEQRPRGQQKASESRTAVMTVFIARTAPIRKADPRVGKWIRELDDDRFQVRENASRALEKLGDAALPALREALGPSPSPEQRRRIRQLLDCLKPIHLAQLKFPKGVRVISLDTLVKEARKDWQSGDTARSWEAATNLAEWADYSEETFPLLVEALQDKREQVRSLAEQTFTRLGKRAEGAMARLKAAAKARSARPGDALTKAIQAVEKGADEPGVEAHWRENRRLRAAIAEHCRHLCDPAKGD